MCQRIKIDDEWCETLGELRAALNGEPVMAYDPGPAPGDELCLCCVDVTGTAEAFAYRVASMVHGWESKLRSQSRPPSPPEIDFIVGG